MKFLTLSATALLASTAFSSPLELKSQKHQQQKRSSSRHGNRKQEISSNMGAIDYSSNWAGAVLIGTAYTSVTGTFVVPTPITEGSGAAWIGIDGDTAPSAILQAGVEWSLTDGAITYNAWYEWFPDYLYTFDPSEISLSAGDSITVTVSANGPSSGSAVIKNNTTGQSVTHTFTSGATQGDLKNYNAEWIVEDYQSDSSLVTFADFGTVTFTECTAVSNGQNIGTTNALLMDIKQNGNVLTSCSIPEGQLGSMITCTYL